MMRNKVMKSAYLVSDVMIRDLMILVNVGENPLVVDLAEDRGAMW